MLLLFFAGHVESTSRLLIRELGLWRCDCSWSLIWFALSVSKLLCNSFGADWPSVFGVGVAPLAFAADYLDASELLDCKFG